MIRVKIALLIAFALLLSACDFSVDKLPLPGGADTGDNPVEVTVTFPDVLDLVVQSTVKVADVTIGKVTDIELKDNRAEVTLEIREDADLPANTLAEIRQTSLLGEKFVSLRAPAEPRGTLANGAHIDLERTNQNPEVEEVLGALSLVLNGGGVAQLKTITSELNKALEGREGSAKSVLTQLSSFMKQLDDNKAGIVNAIEKLNSLSISANKQRKTITTALDELPAALSSLDSQRADLVKMLKALSRLGNVGTRVIKATKTSTIDALTQLQPVLTEFAKSGDDFANAFHVFLTYPFVDEAVGRDPQVARNLHMGDFVNLSIQLDLNLLAPGKGEETACIPLGMIPEGGGINLADLCKEALKKISNCLDTAKLKQCLKALDPVLELPCKILPQLCKKDKKGTRKLLPELPGLNLAGPDGILPDALDGLLGGRNRTAPGGSAQNRAQGGAEVSLDRLLDVYDPVLVRALLPGVAR